MPALRHSDLKIIDKFIRIKKTNNYYINLSRNFKKVSKEFKTKEYASVNQDVQLFKHKRKNIFRKRSEILSDVIKNNFSKKSKILDFGSSKGNLLIELKKKGYKNIYAHDINKSFSNFFKRKKIIFLKKKEILKEKFDLVIFSHSLSYVENIEKILKILMKIVNENGYVILNFDDVSKRPLIFTFSDQKFFFEKKMIKNLFRKFGSIKFINSKFLCKDIVSIIKFNPNKKKKILKINNQTFRSLRMKIEKLYKIKNLCNIYHYNFQTVIALNILKDKIQNIVTLKKKNKNKLNFISFKQHLNLRRKIPLIIFDKKENKKILEALKRKKLKYCLI